MRKKEGGLIDQARQLKTDRDQPDTNLPDKIAIITQQFDKGVQLVEAYRRILREKGLRFEKKEE